MNRCIIFVISSFLLCGCTNMFLMPSRDFYSHPTAAKLQFEDGYFPSIDGTRLHYWYLPSQGPLDEKAPRILVPAKALILQVHGNAENITSHFRGVAFFSWEGFDVMTFDYRGYGKSDKEKDIDGALMDVKAALREANRRAKEKNLPLIVYGQSLGGTLVLKALTEEAVDLRELIIESSFVSYSEIAQDKLDNFWLTWPVQWMAWFIVSDKYSLKESELQKLYPGVQKTLLYSKYDPVVDIKYGDKLAKMLAGPLTYWVHENPGHINSMFVEDFAWRKKLLQKLRNDI